MSAAAIAAVKDPRTRRYVRDLGRAFGGALIFAIPLMMTMEMWSFGLVLDGTRLAAFILVSLPVLFSLARYAGFRRDRGWRDDLCDTFTALAVGFIVSAAALSLLGVIEFDAPARGTLGQLALQSVSGAIGALLSRRQLSSAEPQDAGAREEPDPSYAGELFLMVVGALFLALNIAPTEEMILIAFRATPWHILALVATTLTLMHLLVYAVEFAGQEDYYRPVDAFFHFTVAGYGLVLLTALFVLWVFGRADGQSPQELAASVAVVSFPGGIGAAAARLLV